METNSRPKRMDKQRKIIAVDIDDTVSTGRFWDSEPKPIQGMIDRVNDLYKKGHIIIYHTARHPSYYAITYAWLVKYGCYFHALEMGKLSADFYIDDKNISMEDFYD